MRAVIQRVSGAEVCISGRVSGAIGHGLVVFLGIHRDDDDHDAQWMADKLVRLRIFDDSGGRMNLSLLDTKGEMLIVSQFTLLADCRKGRRPSWAAAAAPDTAQALYRQLIAAVGRHGVRTATGEFQACMDVSLVNNGPVTIILDSRDNL
ncbi:MAG TPA: D-tyrosyl-tRNA(Tyr) deacylase [Desulfobacteraceae bacterium]|nr:D-tyrosyl-tRNA(Tyr) deacylase [Desulfobacteraceae bacterium]